MANVTTVSTRAAMAGLASPAAGNAVFLTEAGREGIFECFAGTPPSDPQQGLYVASTTSGFYWARNWDGMHGKPEWFGAVLGGPDCLTALQACVALCPVTSLAQGDYYISSTWKVQAPYRTVQGVGLSDGYTSASGTRVLCNNASVSVFQVGADTQPPSVNAFLRGVRVKDINFEHVVALTAPSAPINATKCVVATYLLDCEFDRVYTWEPLIGFFMYGCVGTFFRRCKAFRSVAQSGSDFFYGFWGYGTPPILNGGNASLYLEDCTVELGNALSIAKIGLYLNGEAADLFVDRFETSAATSGIVYAASGSGTYGMQDVFFRDCVLDQCSGPAIDISGLNAQAAITIDGGYFQSKSSAQTVIKASGAGAVTICGGAQIICAEAGSTYGVYGNGQKNLTIDPSVKITDCPSGVSIDGDCSGSQILCRISNPVIGDGTKYAIALNSSSKRVRIAPMIDGKAGGFAQMIFLIGTGQDKCLIDPTGVDLAATSSSVKVLINASGISAPGYYTSSGAAGTTGAGIQVTGITV